MNQTKISWTKVTWNPVSGCSKISEGCRHCYAESLSLRFGHTRAPWTAANVAANVRCHPDRLRQPYKLKDPTRIFTNSMSDLFHDAIPDEFISRVFAVMQDLPQHTFQVLTKRPERAAAWDGPWSPNIWMGTSIEDAKNLTRLESLRLCGAAVKFISAEPLLGPLEGLNLEGIGWVIVGGESGFHMSREPERWMDHAWARSIRDEALRTGSAYFFKQSSAVRTELGTALQHEDGSLWLWQQYPGEMTPPQEVKVTDNPQYRIPRRPAPLPLLA